MKKIILFFTLLTGIILATDNVKMGKTLKNFGLNINLFGTPYAITLLENGSDYTYRGYNYQYSFNIGTHIKFLYFGFEYEKKYNTYNVVDIDSKKIKLSKDEKFEFSVNEWQIGILYERKNSKNDDINIINIYFLFKNFYSKNLDFIFSGYGLIYKGINKKYLNTSLDSGIFLSIKTGLIIFNSLKDKDTGEEVDMENYFYDNIWNIENFKSDYEFSSNSWEFPASLGLGYFLKNKYFISVVFRYNFYWFYLSSSYEGAYLSDVDETLYTYELKITDYGIYLQTDIFFEL